MDFIIILAIFMITYIVLRYIFELDMKRLKNIGENKELDLITNKYPNNLELCKELLRMLKNDKVKIVEDKEANTTMYFVMGNKILIANLKDSFTRIQTLAHECLHSIQSKKILWFNFVFSNIYIIFFYTIVLLTAIKILPNKMMFLLILIFMGGIYIFVRIYLENDAMIKARYLAKEYMINKNISKKEEIDRIIEKYDELNNIGIKSVNYQLFVSTLIKNMIFCVVCILR